MFPLSLSHYSQIPGGKLTNADARKCIAELQSQINILHTQEQELHQVITDLKVEVMISKKGQHSQRPDVNGPCPDAPEQFDTDANFLKGAVIEFHEYLGSPELYKLAVEYPTFKNAFQKQTNAEHATALNSTHEMVPVIFDDLNIPTTLWAAAAKVRSQ
ncbi:hypothetical protein Moror_16704 [Moniliophthora roreri MCA 2997]|uniref:Uncharacterized protein n=2 Tax=Moniliophthora roreri TaxID=221103 RepID=V2WID6_MONRO|nr:hypothetical protein Moror_16704 [Moniliophthora roreri MCA 2997]